jgi:hypothetical protein
MLSETSSTNTALSELAASGGEVHSLVVTLLHELDTLGDFTPELWQRLYGAMDELSDNDLDIILRAVGDSSERRRASGR